MAVAIAPPWLELPELDGINTYRVPPTGAIVVPAVVYRPADADWIERQQTYRRWVENYAAVCIVAATAGQDGVAALYAMGLAIKAAIDGSAALAAWEWLGMGGIVEADQAGVTYLAATVRLTFSSEYP